MGPGGSRRYKWQASVGRAHGRALAPPTWHQKIAYKLQLVSAVHPRPPSLARYFILNLYGDLYELYEKTSQLKKKVNRQKSLKMLAEAGEASRLQEAQIFRLFYRSSFFYRNPPPHLRGRVRASFCRERRLNIKLRLLLCILGTQYQTADLNIHVSICVGSCARRQLIPFMHSI